MQIARRDALRLIGRLRQGKNEIFGAHYYSVGRAPWLKGAEQMFEDIELTQDSAIRFIRGDYGVGKTNFAARLIHLALKRGWVTAYIELSDSVLLHEFNQVFGAIVKMLYLPEKDTIEGVESTPPHGLWGILDQYFERVRGSLGLSVGSDIPESARREIVARINSVLTSGRIHGDFAAATRAYITAKLDGDSTTIDMLRRWFSAEPGIKIPDLSVFKPINKQTGKECLRALSALVVGLGYKGTLIIIDELERILQESPSRRRRSYTILRELIDNVDGENGMKQTCFYGAAPPGQFESQKGFIEVEALASRIQQPLPSTTRATDYMGTIVELDQNPLQKNDLMTLAKRIRRIHEIARNEQGRVYMSDAELADLVQKISTNRPHSNMRIREFCIELTSALESAFLREA